MEKEYSELQKKYDLPSFEDMDREFQINGIENTNLLAKEIIKRINDKIELFSGVLEDILNPERLSSLHESSLFTDEEKKIALSIYRKLHYYYRQNLLLDIHYEENKSIEFIKEFYDEWQKMKQKLEKIVTKLKESWNSDRKTKIESSYFG